MLPVNPMTLRVVLTDRPKRVDSDVKLDRLDARTRRFDARQELGGEVETRRWRGGRALLAGEHRLVELRVGDRFGDVGRQRHLPDAMNHVEEAPLPRAEFELDETATPSSICSTTRAVMAPSANTMCAPGLSLRPGFTRHSHAFS